MNPRHAHPNRQAALLVASSLILGATALATGCSSEVKAYEVEHESKTYQVEVEILENTATYVHVAVSVDDGSLPASITPETHSFMCRKPQP